MKEIFSAVVGSLFAGGAVGNRGTKELPATETELNGFWTSVFHVSEAVEKQYFLAIKGQWKGRNRDTIIINVYGPHKDEEKRRFWDSLNNIMNVPDIEWVPHLGKLLANVGDISVIVLERKTLDHTPMLLRDKNNDFGPKPFKNFDIWLEQKETESIISEGWNKEVGGSRPDCVFRNKMKNVKEALRIWSKNRYGPIDIKIDEWKSMANELEPKADLGVLTDYECDEWKKAWQKSRLKWVAEGDDNTAFFHSTIRKRNNKHNIRGLHVNGIWSEEPTTIKNAGFNHFLKGFKQIRGFSPDWSTLDNLSFNNIDASEAELLEAPISENEVWNAIKECEPSKAPGPDCFSVHFYKIYFWLIKNEFMKAIEWFWSNGCISNGCNASFFALIPKVEDPMSLSEFRPISLIGSYYKIIAKILAKRIQKIICKIIGYEQSAFLKKRYILDGILVTNEVVELMKHQKKKCLIFKADFEKAFDSISWDFLFTVMKKMGFGHKWIMWIKSCLSSASISVLVNGSPTNEFYLKRGVRQGDHLSLYLFIIAVEGLNAFVKKALDTKMFRGLEVGEDKVIVSHLQYADDTIFLENGIKRILVISLNSSNALKYSRFGTKETDVWSCKFQMGGVFSTTLLSNALNDQIPQSPTVSVATMRNNLLPLKIGIFIWRALKRRLLICDELDKRGIDLHSLRCPVCDEAMETIDHVLLGCSFANNIWNRIYRWWNLGNMGRTNLDELFRGVKEVNKPNSKSKIWQAIEWISGTRDQEVNLHKHYHHHETFIISSLSSFSLSSRRWVRLIGNGWDCDNSGWNRSTYRLPVLIEIETGNNNNKSKVMMGICLGGSRWKQTRQRSSFS
ncbi:uncharacterized protein [Rutidosis leptorrhynchoides]|uniref:uncharacterized protein n=1 Tax=Rutidosis leptorrhynchoides TaxID=125765 RepID=UPI003A994DF3